MKILLIAPLPPPITGNSLPVKTLYDELVHTNEVDVVNLSKNSYNAGIDSTKRIIQVGRILKDIWQKREKRDLIYFTVSESFAGNVKDLVIYMICFPYRKKMLIHMLGGARMKEILNRKAGIQYKLNKFFISRLGGVVVEGKTQADFFSRVISREKIYIVPNFAEDFLFVTESQVKYNFEKKDPIKILFLSNLIYGKGHNELIEAYLLLSDHLRGKITIDFAGGFESDDKKNEFLSRISGIKGIVYHGLVSGIKKKELYMNSHIFCLPTYYPYEGQPFCILEAYATGCVVVTTDHSGIGDVFRDSINGYQVQKKSIDSLKRILEQILLNNENLVDIALSNLITAQNQYRASIYKSSMRNAFTSITSRV